MSELHEKLRATVTELEDELRELDPVDDQSREVLEEALHEIRAALREQDPADLETDSTLERLERAARSFEESHPTLTGLITRLIDGLGQMGI